jgi:hypothetical protein
MWLERCASGGDNRYNLINSPTREWLGPANEICTVRIPVPVRRLVRGAISNVSRRSVTGLELSGR